MNASLVWYWQKIVVLSGNWTHIFGFWTAAQPIELSNQQGLVASLAQFKCTIYFMTLHFVLDDAQCFEAMNFSLYSAYGTSFLRLRMVPKLNVSLLYI
jgi:hypothetical protein